MEESVRMDTKKIRSKIFVVGFDKFPLIEFSKDKFYRRLIVGNHIDRVIGTNDYRDDIGDNISAKNKYYSELTATYWIWKNIDLEIYGLCHYRRFFRVKHHLLKRNEAITILSKHQVIVSEKTFISKNIADAQADGLGREPIKLIREIIKTKSPRYLEGYDEVMSSSELHPRNMFVMKKELFFDYCDFVFGILEEAEPLLEYHTNIIKNGVEDQRVLGYLAEPLLDTWISTNKINFYELPLRQREMGAIKFFRWLVSNLLAKMHLK